METIEVHLSPEEVRAIGSALAKHVEFSAFKAWSRFGITRALLAKVATAAAAGHGIDDDLAVALADPDWDRAGAWPARPDAQGRYRNA